MGEAPAKRRQGQRGPALGVWLRGAGSAEGKCAIEGERSEDVVGVFGGAAQRILGDGERQPFRMRHRAKPRAHFAVDDPEPLSEDMGLLGINLTQVEGA